MKAFRSLFPSSTTDFHVPIQWIGTGLKGSEKATFSKIKNSIEMFMSQPISNENLLRIIDLIDQTKDAGMSQSMPILVEIVLFLRIQLLSNDPEKVFKTITLLDVLIKNAGFRIHLLIGRRKFMKTFGIVIRRHRRRVNDVLAQRVSSLALDCIQAWGEAFYSRRNLYPHIYETYSKIRYKHDIRFPRPDFDPSRVPIFLGEVSRSELRLAEEFPDEDRHESSRSSEYTQDEEVKEETGFDSEVKAHIDENLIDLGSETIIGVFPPSTAVQLPPEQHQSHMQLSSESSFRQQPVHLSVPAACSQSGDSSSASNSLNSLENPDFAPWYAPPKPPRPTKQASADVSSSPQNSMLSCCLPQRVETATVEIPVLPTDLPAQTPPTKPPKPNQAAHGFDSPNVVMGGLGKESSVNMQLKQQQDEIESFVPSKASDFETPAQSAVAHSTAVPAAAESADRLCIDVSAPTAQHMLGSGASTLSNNPFDDYLLFQQQQQLSSSSTVSYPNTLSNRGSAYSAGLNRSTMYSPASHGHYNSLNTSGASSAGTGASGPHSFGALEKGIEDMLKYELVCTSMLKGSSSKSNSADTSFYNMHNSRSADTHDSGVTSTGGSEPPSISPQKPIKPVKPARQVLTYQDKTHSSDVANTVSTAEALYSLTDFTPPCSAKLLNSNSNIIGSTAALSPTPPTPQVVQQTELSDGALTAVLDAEHLADGDGDEQGQDQQEDESGAETERDGSASDKITAASVSDFSPYVLLNNSGSSVNKAQTTGRTDRGSSDEVLAHSAEKAARQQGSGVEADKASSTSQQQTFGVNYGGGATSVQLKHVDTPHNPTDLRSNNSDIDVSTAPLNNKVAFYEAAQQRQLQQQRDRERQKKTFVAPSSDPTVEVKFYGNQRVVVKRPGEK